MQTIALHDKAELATALERDPYRNAYALGDLDDFFWPYTQWYGVKSAQEVLEKVVLLYMAPDHCVVQAIGEEYDTLMRELLTRITPLLPRRFYAHLTMNLLDILEEHYPNIESHGIYAKMGLKNPTDLDNIDVSGASQLTIQDRNALEQLYRESYPENWFDARMLETGQYFGVWRDTRLVSVAGIHVYSPTYKVAALGNITTHPAYRGQGLAAVTTAALCRSLLENVSHISLNVHTENIAAIRCYERLGFERIALYGEYTISI